MNYVQIHDKIYNNGHLFWADRSNKSNTSKGIALIGVYCYYNTNEHLFWSKTSSERTPILRDQFLYTLFRANTTSSTPLEISSGRKTLLSRHLFCTDTSNKRTPLFNLDYF